MTSDAVAQFRAAMLSRGLRPPLPIEPGQLYRFPSSERAGDMAGWCKLFDDRRGGVFGDWRTGLEETWQAERIEPMTAGERKRIAQLVAEARREREAEERAKHHEAAQSAESIWQSAKQAPADHPYLIAKGIQSHGLRVHYGELVLPVRRGTELASLQFIAANGDKRFLKGGKVAGGSFIIGKPDGTLCIVEGFATGASVHEATGHAVAVAFNSGNLLAVARTMREKLRDLRLILCADDDSGTPGNPGLSKAREAAGAVGGLLAVPDFGTQRPDGASDFNDLAWQAGADAVRRCIEIAALTEDAAPTAAAMPVVAGVARFPNPEPLRRPTPPPEAYPSAELGEVLRPAAEAIRRVIQAPEAIIGGALLAAASLAAQALANVVIDDRSIPLSLWLLNVAESGERKSAVDNEVMRAAREHERELADLYDAEKLTHDAALAEYSARCEAAKADFKKSKGKGLAEALEELGPPPPAPLIPRVTAADFTAEGLFKLLAAGYPSIGAFTDEAALVFGGHGMTKETVMRTAGALCRLWDRGELDRVRSGDGAQKLYGRRFAMHLLAQPIIARRALSDDVLAGQGFLARCLLAWPHGTAGSRPYVAESLGTDPAILQLRARLLRLHRESLPLADGKTQELAPRALSLTTEAFNQWRELHDAIEEGTAEGGPFAQVKPWASKTAEQALRIAGVLAMTENSAARQIEVETIRRAGELALWHLSESVRLAGTAELSLEVRNAEALLGWCHETGRQYLYSRAALRLGPSCIRERKLFSNAMAVLEEAGWALPVEGGMELDGARRRDVWRITPASEDA